jgi:ATP-dependent exoDNAse (exonuclease V) beta subunit
VKHNIVYHGGFPSIFGKMANLTSDFYQDKHTKEISPDLPPGRMKFKEKYVKSLPISISGLKEQAYIRGRFDAVIEFEDGSYGVVDYKTSDAKEERAAFYSRQLSAYAYALENPAPNALSLSPVSKLGYTLSHRSAMKGLRVRRWYS